MAGHQNLTISRQCPRCDIADHLHIELCIDNNGHFFVASEETDGTLVINEHAERPVVFNAAITCCACDYYDERPVRVQ